MIKILLVSRLERLTRSERGLGGYFIDCHFIGQSLESLLLQKWN